MRKTTASVTQFVTFVQPYLPGYRVALFETLSDILNDNGLTLRVAHSSPSGEQATRGDARRGSWSTDLPSRDLRIGNVTLHYRPSWRLLRDSSVIVAELASTNIDTYLLAAQRRVPLILWGHGRAFVTKPRWLDDRLELALAKRARHVFTYTPEGSESLIARGLPPVRVTVIHNSTDTVGLRTEMGALTDDEVAAFRRSTGTQDADTAVFIGALDDSKNLELLLDASTLIARERPAFRLLIAGDGPHRADVERRAALQPEVVVLPHARLHDLALLGAVSSVCLMPGRVGLVAVDAMTLGLPVVTTDWPHHAPERIYLDHTNSITTLRSASDFAQGVTAVLNQSEDGQAGAYAAPRKLPSIENMAAAMLPLILQEAGTGKARRKLD